MVSEVHRNPIQWVLKSGFSGVKRPGLETDHSHPSSATYKNVELYLHSAIHLQGIVLNSFISGMILPYFTSAVYTVKHAVYLLFY